jgi:hypothetical protein
MTKVNYTAMSDQELKQYFLIHRDDEEAFYVYMDRRSSRPQGMAIKLDDPDWEAKVIAIIQAQLNHSS